MFLVRLEALGNIVEAFKTSGGTIKVLALNSATWMRDDRWLLAWCNTG